MPNDIIDTLKIGIEYVSKKSVSNELDKIGKSLIKLQARVELVDMSKITNQLNKLNTVDLSKVTKQVNSLVKNLKELKAFKNFTMNVGSSSRLDKIFGNLDQKVNKYKSVTINSGSNSNGEVLPPQAFTQYVPNFTMLNAYGQEYGLIVRETANDWQKQFIELVQVRDELEKVVEDEIKNNDILQSATRNADKLGKSLQKAKKELKGDSDSKNGGIFGSLGKSLIRIGFYRLIRRAIQIVTQSIKTGIDNLVEFSDKFNQSISEVKSYFTLIKNTLGTLIEPILNVLRPLLVELSQFFVEQTNNLTQIFSAMSGETTFTKAKYNAEDYLKTLKKLKAILVSFDEINAIGSNNGEIKPQDMFEANVQIEKRYQELGNTLGVIRNIFDTIIESELVKTLKDLVTSDTINILNSLAVALKLISPLIKPLTDVLNVIAQPLSAISGLISLIGEPIAKLVNWLVSKLGLDSIGGGTGSANNGKTVFIKPTGNQLDNWVGGSSGSGAFAETSSGARPSAVIDLVDIEKDLVVADAIVNGVKKLGQGVSNVINKIGGGALPSGTGTGLTGIGGSPFSALARQGFVGMDGILMNQIGKLPQKSDIVDTLSSAFGKNASGDIYIQLIDENGNVKNEQLVSKLDKKNRREGKQVVPVLVNW